MVTLRRSRMWELADRLISVGLPRVRDFRGVSAKAFDGEGWFRTGDIGSIDDDGYLTITGRKKEIIVTAGGKNVAPNYLEDPIRSNPIVGQVVVAGDQKPFISALVTLDSEMIDAWLANNGFSEKISLQEATTHPAVS